MGHEDLYAAYRIADRFITVQDSSEGGWDWSIFDENRKLLDGGVYDGGPDTATEMFGDILEDIMDDDRLCGSITENSVPERIDYWDFIDEIG